MTQTEEEKLAAKAAKDAEKAAAKAAKDAEGADQEPSSAGSEPSDELSVVNEAIKTVESEGVKVRRPQPGSIAARQLLHFAAQPKVRYRLARQAGEKVGAFTPVTVNDLMITVLHGFNVNIPEDIATYLDDSQAITDNALTDAALKELPKELQV